MPQPIASAMPKRVHAKAIHRINSWLNFSLFGAPIAAPPGQPDRKWRNGRYRVEGKRRLFLCIIFRLMSASSASKELIQALIRVI